jgi:hypothetical protein
LGFGLLALASCGALWTVAGLDDLSLADLQGGGPAWTPPPLQPTPDAPPPLTGSGAADAGQDRFTAGQQTRNVTGSPVNLRATAGYLAKPEEDVLAQLQPGDVAEILGPSAQADGLTWWLVRTAVNDGRTVEGWVAEATASGVTILGE